jgi:hypothetical protein
VLFHHFDRLVPELLRPPLSKNADIDSDKPGDNDRPQGQENDDNAVAFSTRDRRLCVTRRDFVLVLAGDLLQKGSGHVLCAVRLENLHLLGLYVEKYIFVPEEGSA